MEDESLNIRCDCCKKHHETIEEYESCFDEYSDYKYERLILYED